MIPAVHRFLMAALCMLGSAFLATAHAQTGRIEPPNWWVGMKHSQLQILLYGDDISGLEPRITYDGVSITSVKRTENPNYLFLYLDIARETKAGTMQIELLNEGVARTAFSYELWEREEGSAERKGFDQSDVMYLITPDRFANGDPSNDSVEGMREAANRSFEGGRHGGDIKGIVDHLDYIEDMGFTAIWVNPVLENDMESYSYHGYATTDFYQVDRRFGSNEDYRALSKAAKKRGIKLIMDMILNHSGSEHWFVKDKPTPDWINFGGTYVNTSHRRNTIQDIHAADIDKKKFSDGWFVETMPDLNQRNDLLADYLIQNTIWWIEYADMSGIRMDTYPYPDKNFMAHWTCHVMEEYPNFNIVGEEWVTNPAIVSYWQAGKQNHDGYTSCLPSLMDFPIQAELTLGLSEEEKAYGSGLIRAYETLALDFLYTDADNLVIFPDNHDMDRIVTQLGGDIDLVKMALGYFATMRGIPQIYYGTEILMNNTSAPNDHGVIRSDFPGGWAGDTVNGFTGEGLGAEAKAFQAWFKKLFNWRKDARVIHTGKTTHFAVEDGIYAYFRYNDAGKVMVIMNKNTEGSNLDLSRFAEMLQGARRAKNIMTDKTLDLSAGLHVAGKTAAIFEIE